MKTLKRVIAILSIIILALVVGYLVYTGSQLTDVMNESDGVINAIEGVIYD